MRKINPKCLACSKIEFPNVRITNINYVKKPDCWAGDTCSKKRSYYRKLDYYRAKAREAHRYLRHTTKECRLCKSKFVLEVHHIMPQCLGGNDNPSNLMTLCKTCHRLITNYYKTIGLT